MDTEAKLLLSLVAAHLIAAKSVLRFGEVRDPENRMEAEYIIIGTLLSFTLGSVASFGCRYLLSLTG